MAWFSYSFITMQRGDQVTVAQKDGKTAVFTVTRVARCSKSRFPSRVVDCPIDHAGLGLITCGGTCDAARHRYLDNVAVFARLDAVRACQPSITSAKGSDVIPASLAT
jgi:hypothetical protein